MPTSLDGSANTSGRNTMTNQRAGTALHPPTCVRDDQDGNDEYWRNAAKRIIPFGDTSATYHLEQGEQVPVLPSLSALTLTVAARRRSISRLARMSRDAQPSHSTWAGCPRGTWWSSLPPRTRLGRTRRRNDRRLVQRPRPPDLPGTRRALTAPRVEQQLRGMNERRPSPTKMDTCNSRRSPRRRGGITPTRHGR